MAVDWGIGPMGAIGLIVLSAEIEDLLAVGSSRSGENCLLPTGLMEFQAE